MLKKGKTRKGKNKLIGGEEYNNSEKMYNYMLRAIVDFTISKSTCNVFYKDKNGVIKAL